VTAPQVDAQPAAGPTHPAGVPGRLGIVVVNYGSSSLLETNLGRMDLDARSVEVVVVDNHSTEAERVAVQRLARERGWTLVPLSDNRGFGPGVNAGIAAARARGCECYLVLNPDAHVGPEVLAELWRTVTEQPLALVSPRIVASDGSTFFRGAELSLLDGRIRGWAEDGSRRLPPGVGEDWVSGACLVVHDDLLQRLGGLAPQYFLYWEDLDLSHRCLQAGGSLVVRTDLVAVHDAGGTQGVQRGRAKSALYYRYNCRNRLVFAAAHLPRRRIVRWMVATPAVSREILLRGGRRQLLADPTLLWAAARGTVAGLAMAAAALLGRRPVGSRPPTPASAPAPRPRAAEASR
jgi:GT2 family glycosyltransferase